MFDFAADDNPRARLRAHQFRKRTGDHCPPPAVRVEQMPRDRALQLGPLLAQPVDAIR